MTSGRVAVFNSSVATIELLEAALEQVGLRVDGVLMQDVRNGRIDLESFVERHDPAVVLFDVAPPYEDNWQLFQAIRSHPAMAHRRFVVTSTDAATVADLAREARLVAIAAKPFDLDAVITATQRAMMLPRDAG
jgi:CheY-like chemotaxis protein